MFEHRPHPTAVRSLMFAACLALLSGCGSNTDTSATEQSQVTGAPAAPADLRAIPGNSQASLTWSASAGAASYDVKRSTTNGGPYTQVASAESPSYTDATVSNSTTYYYVVTAANSIGESTDSPQASVTPDPTITTPSIPMGLVATAGNAQVSLTWTMSGGATGYHVKRAATRGGPYTQLAAPTSTGYIDSSAINGTTYYYVVSALSAAGESANSAEVSAIPVAAGAAPTVPTNLTTRAGSGQTNLTWSASSGATSYHVKRATTSGGPYTQLATPTSTGYTDSSVTNGTTYYYVVSALNAAGESANSAEASATPEPPAATPVAPTNLTAGAGNAQANLTWSASNGATSYHVKRSTANGGPYTQIAAPTSTSYTDASVVNGTPYFYVVSALGSTGESANSAQVSVVPAVPTSNPPPTTFGTWTNITPSNADLTDTLDCGNYGVQTVQADSTNPSNIYAEFNCQGIWKSTDYGATWTGPINTGANGSTAGDCAGGITLAPTAGVPTIHEACIRGAALGYWRSTDGGVSWTRINLSPLPSNRQDVYPPVVDPYNSNHLLMCGHEQDYIIQSTDGGQTWTNVSLASGMLENGGTGFVFFLNTGNSATTANTWLWIGQQAGGVYGTWRTTNGGVTWSQVDANEHPHGASQIYQPDTNGVVYMAGAYSTLGWGVLRSTDYGQTWTHVGATGNETVVFGTSKNVYSMYGWAAGIGSTMDPSFELAAQPATGTWSAPGTPVSLVQGPAQVSVGNDGAHNIMLGAMWVGGLWRYVEP